MMIWVWIICRTIQGMAAATLNTTWWAIVTAIYQRDNQKYLGVLSAAIGVGLLIGPVIGSTLYTLFGFQGTFLSIGFLFLFLIPILVKLVPSSVDINDREVSESSVLRLNDNNSTDNKEQRPLSYLRLLWSRIYFFTFGAVLLSF